MSGKERRDHRLTAEYRFWVKMAAKPSKPRRLREEAKATLRDMERGR